MSDLPTARRSRQRGFSQAYVRKLEYASASPAHASERWILQFHDAWSRLTHSAFYTQLGDGRLSAGQFGRWLRDRAAISLAVLRAATRVAEKLKSLGEEYTIPLLGVAREDAAFLCQYATRLGFEFGSEADVSRAAQMLMRLFDEVTGDGVDVAMGLAAVWSYMLSSWTGWSLCKQRQGEMSAHFAPVGDFIARLGAVTCLVASQGTLNRILQECGATVGERGRRVFEEVLAKGGEVLEATVGMGEEGGAACVCGRKGHVRERCTFKSRV